MDPNASQRMRWELAMAFEDAVLQTNPGVSAFSDIDGHQVNTPWREPLGAFTLFDFSAKFDPVPSMLTQNHESVIPDYYGLTTSFRRDRLKPGVTVLAEEEGASAREPGPTWAGTTRRTRSIRSATSRRTWTCTATPRAIA
jgi:hypothetical protein